MEQSNTIPEEQNHERTSDLTEVLLEKSKEIKQQTGTALQAMFDQIVDAQHAFDEEKNDTTIDRSYLEQALAVAPEEFYAWKESELRNDSVDYVSYI